MLNFSFKDILAYFPHTCCVAGGWHRQARQTGSEVWSSWSLASRVWVHFLCQRCVKTLAQDSTSSGGWRNFVLSRDEVPRHGGWMWDGIRDLEWAWRSSASISGCTQIGKVSSMHEGTWVCAQAGTWVCAFLDHGWALLVCISLQLTGASCCSNCLFIARQRRPLAQGRQTDKHFRITC